MIHLPTVRRSLIPLLGLLLLVASCRSTPEGPPADILGWIPPESDLLIRLAVPGNEDLAALLLSGAGMDAEELSAVLKRAEVVVIGIEAADERPIIHLATVGQWPRGVMGSALGGDWDKVSRYRWEGPEGMELTVPTGNELILSSGRVDQMLDRSEAGALPEVPTLMVDARPAELEVWMTDPGVFVEGNGMLSLLGDAGLELKNVDLVLARDSQSGEDSPATYTLRMNIRPGDPGNIPGMTFVFRLAMAVQYAGTGLLDYIRIDSGTDAILVEMESISLEILGELIDELGLLPGVES